MSEFYAPFIKSRDENKINRNLPARNKGALPQRYLEKSVVD